MANSPEMGGFPSTDWSAVRRAGQESASGDRTALGRLLADYLPALRAHLLAGRRVPPSDVDDLLQGFVTSKILENDLLSSAHPARGRFRGLLLSALDRYVTSQWRINHAKKRGRGNVVSLEQADVDPPFGATGDDGFDVAWARQVITQTLARMHRAYQKRGRQRAWELFEAAILGPTLEGAAVPSAEELAQRFGFATARAARNALITTRRLFVRTLRQVIGEYAENEDEVDEELRSLRRALFLAAEGEFPRSKKERGEETP